MSSELCCICRTELALCGGANVPCRPAFCAMFCCVGGLPLISERPLRTKSKECGLRCQFAGLTASLCCISSVLCQKITEQVLN